jgi:hypothetical protein
MKPKWTSLTINLIHKSCTTVNFGYGTVLRSTRLHTLVSSSIVVELMNFDDFLERIHLASDSIFKINLEMHYVYVFRTYSIQNCTAYTFNTGTYLCILRYDFIFNPSVWRIGLCIGRNAYLMLTFELTT